MKLLKKQVEHIARLARIKLTDREKDKYQSELSSILDFVEQLNKVDVAGIEPTAQITGLKNVKRLDKVKPFVKPDKLIEQAPERKDRFVKVKAVIE